MKYIIKYIITCFLLIYSCHSFASFAEKEPVKQFIDEMTEKHSFDKAALNNLFSRFDTSQDIINKISKPFEKVTWDKYQSYLVTEERINAGVNFWQENEKVLNIVEENYKVPSEIIISILGIETFYGKYKGKYPVIQALATLAFDYAPRSTFFKKELEQFLLLAKEQNFNPEDIYGSYAGAIGIPQFISSSYRNYAVSLNKQSTDIINDVDSAIASVANYFKLHGWEYNKDIVHDAFVINSSYQKLLSDKLEKPKYNLDALKRHNISTNKNLNENAKFSLIELELQNGNKEYKIAENNFYVITRYNHSKNYAMAVYELSKKIKEKKENEHNKI